MNRNPQSIGGLDEGIIATEAIITTPPQTPPTSAKATFDTENLCRRRTYLSPRISVPRGGINGAQQYTPPTTPEESHEFERDIPDVRLLGQLLLANHINRQNNNDSIVGGLATEGINELSHGEASSRGVSLGTANAARNIANQREASQRSGLASKSCRRVRNGPRTASSSINSPMLPLEQRQTLIDPNQRNEVATYNSGHNGLEESNSTGGREPTQSSSQNQLEESSSGQRRNVARQSSNQTQLEPRRSERRTRKPRREIRENRNNREVRNIVERDNNIERNRTRERSVLEEVSRLGGIRVLSGNEMRNHAETRPRRTRSRKARQRETRTITRETRTRDPRARETRRREPSAGETRTRETRAVETRTGETRDGETRSREPQTREITRETRTRDPRARETRREPSGGETRAVETRAVETRAVETRAVEPRTREARARETRSQRLATPSRNTRERLPRQARNTSDTEGRLDDRIYPLESLPMNHRTRVPSGPPVTPAEPETYSEVNSPISTPRDATRARNRRRITEAPPPMDEYAETPPYRERLHRKYDLLSYDPRYNVPVLRINRSLIKNDLLLQKVIIRFAKFNLLPPDVDVWDLDQIDDRFFQDILPQLLPDDSISDRLREEIEQIELRTQRYSELSSNTNSDRARPENTAELTNSTFANLLGQIEELELLTNRYSLENDIERAVQLSLIENLSSPHYSGFRYNPVNTEENSESI